MAIGLSIIPSNGTHFKDLDDRLEQAETTAWTVTKGIISKDSTLQEKIRSLEMRIEAFSLAWRIDLAIGDMEDIFHLGDTSLYNHAILANLYLQSENYLAANQEYQAIIAEDLDSPRFTQQDKMNIHLDYARSLKAVHKYKLAFEMLSAGNKLAGEPERDGENCVMDIFHTFCLYARSLTQQTETYEVVGELEDMSDTGIIPSYVHETLGNMYNTLGNTSLAVKHFEAALEGTIDSPYSFHILDVVGAIRSRREISRITRQENKGSNNWNLKFTMIQKMQ